jgi:hypothetical protein
MDANVYNADIWLLLAALDNCRRREIMGCHPNVAVCDTWWTCSVQIISFSSHATTLLPL